MISNTSPDKYAGLITVFAVILAVEYAGSGYDVWDAFVGILAIFLGYKFFNTQEANDQLFSFLTACLVGLGFVSLFSVVWYVSAGFPPEPQSGCPEFMFEAKRFFVFSILTLFFWWGNRRFNLSNETT